MARQGRNLVVVTGTASGKTLCYNLPVLDALLRDPGARALYLFPTKALAQDQRDELAGFFPDGERRRAGGHLRRRHAGAGAVCHPRPARILISNPDMLHTGILPHHTLWADFLRGLRFVVIDEMHAYRGVFGSHVANLLRRLKRICAFYGGAPQFILTSATIGNPAELAERLIEAPVQAGRPRTAPAGAPGISCSTTRRWWTRPWASAAAPCWRACAWRRTCAITACRPSSSPAPGARWR